MQIHIEQCDDVDGSDLRTSNNDKKRVDFVDCCFRDRKLKYNKYNNGGNIQFNSRYIKINATKYSGCEWKRFLATNKTNS